ncbi:unnamed protein product [Urochloa humidicola]
MSHSRLRRGREEEEAEGEDGGRAGSEGSTPAKRPRGCSCNCCLQRREEEVSYESQIGILTEERKNHQREMQELHRNSRLELNEVKKLISEQNSFIHLICERLNTLISETSALGEHVRKYSDLRALSHQSEIRAHRLKFENKCCDDKYSRHDIMADDGSPIKVAIYDHENMIITNGPLSSMQVKVVVLDGEFNKESKEQWNGDSFLTSIIRGRTGKPPLFANELFLKLQNGVAHLNGVKFQDNSSFVPSKTFRLGVMAADDNIPEKILEGISEPFSVKDGRGFQKKKAPHPSLSDPIYKLRKIAENGDRHKPLEQKHINLVQDFLWFYNKDKDNLRQACGNIPDHDWEIIVGHALSCKPGHEIYSYCIPGKDATIFFNSLYSIVGAKVNGAYTSCEEFNKTQKELVEKFKTKAYDSLKAVQYENKETCHEDELIVGDRGSCYLKGSCSMPAFSTQPTGLYEEPSYHGDIPESLPALQSPRPLQRWVKIVAVVKTLHFWNKKSEMSAFIRELISIPIPESSFAMPDMSDN